MEHEDSGLELESLQVQLAFLVTPSMIQPWEAGMARVPANRPRKEPPAVIAGEKAYPLHPVQDRMLGPGEVDYPGHVGEPDAVGSSRREIRPLDAALDPVPVDSALSPSEHLHDCLVVQLDNLGRAADVHLFSRVQQLWSHPGDTTRRQRHLAATISRNRRKSHTNEYMSGTYEILTQTTGPVP